MKRQMSAKSRQELMQSLGERYRSGSRMAKHRILDEFVGFFTRVAVRAPFRDGRWLRFARVFMDGPPYGGLFATARGFCRFLRGQLARTPTPALGWRAGRVAGVAYLGKPGGGPGFCGSVRVYPDAGIATAWLSNHMAVSEARIAAFGDAIDRFWFAESEVSSR